MKESFEPEKQLAENESGVEKAQDESMEERSSSKVPYLEPESEPTRVTHQEGSVPRGSDEEKREGKELRSSGMHPVRKGSNEMRGVVDLRRQLEKKARVVTPTEEKVEEDDDTIRIRMVGVLTDLARVSNTPQYSPQGSNPGQAVGAACYDMASVHSPGRESRASPGRSVEVPVYGGGK